MVDSVKTVTREIASNWYRMLRLALYELKIQNSGTIFGVLWNFISPALQIFVYWFVFAIGLNSSDPRGGYPYIIWMMVGIIPWFFIGNTLTSSMSSIYSFGGVLKRMYLPLSIVPIKSILAMFFSHLGAMAVVLFIFLLCGYSLTPGSLGLFYYMLCALAFLSGYALLTSAVNVLFKDLQKLMPSVIRLLFYLSPVVWVQDALPENIQWLLKLNPIAYVITGYRNSILYGSSLLLHWKQGAYFWVFTLVLFVVGCNVHMKFRKQFLDLI